MSIAGYDTCRICGANYVEGMGIAHSCRQHIANSVGPQGLGSLGMGNQPAIEAMERASYERGVADANRDVAERMLIAHKAGVEHERAQLLELYERDLDTDALIEELRK